MKETFKRIRILWSLVSKHPHYLWSMTRALYKQCYSNMYKLRRHEPVLWLHQLTLSTMPYFVVVFQSVEVLKQNQSLIQSFSIHKTNFMQKTQL